MNANGALTPARQDGYVAAVCAELAEQDITVLHVELGYTPLRRAALALSIDPDDFDSPFHEAEELLLLWTEEDGWSLVAPVVQNDVVTRAPWHHGFIALPTPEAVANWAAVLLARPDLTISREDGPFRNRHDADAAFEDVLRQYATSEAGHIAD